MDVEGFTLVLLVMSAAAAFAANLIKLVTLGERSLYHPIPPLLGGLMGAFVFWTSSKTVPLTLGESLPLGAIGSTAGHILFLLGFAVYQAFRGSGRGQKK